MPNVYGSMRDWTARPVGGAVASATVMTIVAAGCDGAGSTVPASVVVVGRIADAGIAIRSDDLGQSWSTVLELVANSFAAVDFVDRDHGWIVAGSAIQRTRTALSRGATSPRQRAWRCRGLQPCLRP